jgi:hypothetical protein
MLMQSSWGLIKVGVQKNLDTKRGEKPMETEEYMRCYTAVHEFCTTHKAVIPISAASRNKKGDGTYELPSRPIFLCCAADLRLKRN